MKVAIVVFTKTGNSAVVGRAVAESLRSKGHEAELHLLRPSEEVTPGTRNVTFRQMPDISASDTLVLGGPVWAFRASPPLVAYASQAAPLEGKRAACFVTHGLPFGFAGPNRALAKLTRLLESRGAQVVSGAKVHCPGKPKAERVAEATTQLVDALTR
jgi:flavodoxin